MESTYRLVMRSGPNVGKSFSLDKSEVFVGRDLSNDIVINDGEISRRHARLFTQGSNFVIEDLGSTNGTSVNGQRLMGPYILRPGEIITFGEHVNLVFEVVQVDPDATLASSARPVAPVMPVQQQPPPPPPVYRPAPVAPPPPPVQSYAGQVPPPPEQEVYAPPRKFPWLIVIIVVALLLICGCVGALVLIDQTNSWCSIFGPILNILLGAGSCP
jgi:predicted component of type VI protein secretion system